MDSRSRVTWYLRRLQSMSADEALSHARRSVMNHQDDFQWRYAPAFWRRRWRAGNDVPLIVGAPTHESIGPLREERVMLLMRRCSGALDDITAAAEGWLTGLVDVLGYENVDLAAAGPALDRDPITLNQWPARHGRLIDYRHSSVGDPKLIWELNRCQELPLLALAWLLTGEERFGFAAENRLIAWISSHPPGRGIAWANAFEPAIRAISIAVAYDALRGRRKLHSSDRIEIERSLWQHGRWISRELSTHSSANNHLVGELVGLLAIAVLLPELANAAEWRALALEELSREADKQILPDGFGAEQAFGYTLFTVELLLLAASLVMLTGRDAPTAIVAALHRASDALTTLVDVDEADPAFGDDDDGRVLVVDGRNKRDARHVAASLAACTGDERAARLAESPDPASLLLFGGAAETVFTHSANAPAPGDHVFPHGGMVIFRRSGARLLFDVGPLGYLSIAAHGHADALQIDLSAEGRELVADPGTGSYFGNPELRRTMRSTQAHATVAVDALDQSEAGGPFLWIRHARSRILTVDLEAGYAVGEHDGYVPLSVRHRRAVVALGAPAFLVVDWLSSSAERAIDQTWPLGRGLHPRADGKRVTVSTENGLTALLAILEDSVGGNLVLERNGWFSRRLEAAEHVWTIRRQACFRGTTELVTLLVPVTSDTVDLPETSVVVKRGVDLVDVEVSVDDSHLKATLKLGGDPPTVSII